MHQHLSTYLRKKSLNLGYNAKNFEAEKNMLEKSENIL